MFCYLVGYNQGCFSILPITFFIYINLVWLVSAIVFDVYKIDHQSFKKAILFSNVKTIIFFFFLFLLFFQIFTFNYYSRDDIKYLFVIFFAALLFWKFTLYYIFLLYRESGYNYRNVIIIGYNDKATELKDYFNNNPWRGYRFKGFFTYHKSDKKNIEGTY